MLLALMETYIALNNQSIKLMLYLKILKRLRLPSFAQVLFQKVVSWSFLDPILNHDTRAADDLTGLSFFIDLTHASPFAKLLIVVNFDEVNVVLSTKSFH